MALPPEVHEARRPRKTAKARYYDYLVNGSWAHVGKATRAPFWAIKKNTRPEKLFPGIFWSAGC